MPEVRTKKTTRNQRKTRMKKAKALQDVEPLRHPNGTLKVPLTPEQCLENIALHFPTLAKTCYRKIVRQQNSPPTLDVATITETDNTSQCSSNINATVDAPRSAEPYNAELTRIIQEEMRLMRQVIEDDERIDALYTDDESDEDVIASLTRVVKCAMDSGACASVMHPDLLPAGVVPSGNPSGQVFHGANNSPIRRFGHAVTRMKNGSMDVGCGWQVAEVTRPLNSVADVCGPIEHELGHQDVLFNNKTCFVVPPGVVAAIMKHVAAVAEYPREGNLYLAEVELSSFTRQAQDQ